MLILIDANCFPLHCGVKSWISTGCYRQTRRQKEVVIFLVLQKIFAKNNKKILTYAAENENVGGNFLEKKWFFLLYFSS